ncbi:hypothetical protein M8A51_02610 [Schlegelella sp. S2-27]|uniref:Periplasmic heavy metal sensor n=1 Tax=Caldimonas mangrovi TaxID=2944811 RepID=A0ABT0YIB5_9BURK|nr:hypothetical protein [Caldimonas mangrovi]MCM5678418.1 hypothetical protein [Caldimonas mangrovi]
MERRTLLRLGLGSAVLLALAGGGAALLRPGLEGVRLTRAGREVLRAVTLAVLDGSLPQAAAAREQELARQIARVEEFVSALPRATRSELSQLVGLLGTAPGRVALAGLHADWTEASVPDVQQALESMRQSRLELRRQAYHALRDITNGTFYAVPEHWALMGYPGPPDL